MEESTTYQFIVSRGRLKEARRLVLRQDRIKFGEPNAGQVTAIESLDDLQRLETLSDRLMTVSTWAELLAVP